MSWLCQSAPSTPPPCPSTVDFSAGCRNNWAVTVTQRRSWWWSVMMSSTCDRRCPRNTVGFLKKLIFYLLRILWSKLGSCLWSDVEILSFPSGRMWRFIWRLRSGVGRTDKNLYFCLTTFDKHEVRLKRWNKDETTHRHTQTEWAQ